MNKDAIINSFFNVFKQAKIQNPQIQFNHSTMYYALTRLGVFSNNKYLLTRNPVFDEIVKKDGLFPRWVNRFLNKKNTHAFVDPLHNYFCRFEYGDLFKYDNVEFIKIYVPMIKSHIEEGVNIIFDFIDKKNIKHTSKITSDIRIDDIVIRVTSKEDADAIIKFINNNKYIKKGLLPPNPFAFNEDGIALACDGNASFNSVLSVLLEEFINKNNPYDLTVDNFYNYLNGLYNHIQNKRIDSKYFISSIFKNNSPNTKDFERILVLLINSHNPNFTYEDYINHFYSGLNNKYQETNSSTNIEQEIFNALKIMTLENSLDDSIRMLYRYVYYGDDSYITSTNNLKNNLVNSNFRSDALNLLHSSNINFVNICLKIVDKYQEDYDIYNNEKRATM